MRGRKGIMKSMKKYMAGLLLGSLILTCTSIPVAAAEIPASTTGNLSAATEAPASSEEIQSDAASMPSTDENPVESLPGHTEDSTIGQSPEAIPIDKTDALALAVYYLYSPISNQNLLPDDYSEFEFMPLYDDDKAVVAYYVKYANGAYLIINNNKENPFVTEYGIGKSSDYIEAIREHNPEMEIIYDGLKGVRGRDFDTADDMVEPEEITYHVCYPHARHKDTEQMGILSFALGMVKDGELKIDPKWAKDKAIDAFVYRLYDTCLGRSADEKGFAEWRAALRNGVRAGKVVKGFFYSDEYVAKKKESMQYIMDLYMAFVGRVFDAKGYQSWNEAMYYGATRDQVFRGFARSEEFKKLCLDNGLVP